MTQEDWWVGGAFVLGVLLLTTSNKVGLQDPREADLDALASMLIAETGFVAAKNEMAQIVFVAVNRAKRNNKPLRDVVTPPGSPTWNTGALYKKRFDEAESNPRWLQARAFVEEVLAGAYTNLGATSFVHPGAMPEPPCASNRIATPTIAGTRCLPSWVVGGNVVGKAMFA